MTIGRNGSSRYAMAVRDRAGDRGRLWARASLVQVAEELREARLAADVHQSHVANAAGLTQSQVSRVERAASSAPRIDDLAAQASALGLRLSLKLYPVGSPVRDIAQLRLLERFRSAISPAWDWHTEVLVGSRGDLRAWDVMLRGPASIGVDAETRLRDIQALQRRIEAKQRDSGVDCVALLVGASRHNRRVLREHQSALASSFPYGSRAVLAALRAGRAPAGSGIVVL